jgi:hypothetical protein
MHKKILPILFLLFLVGGSLILISNSRNQASNCTVEGVDWGIAVQAISEHAKETDQQDFGEADIQEHFKSHCTEDMAIYDAYVTGR